MTTRGYGCERKWAADACCCGTAGARLSSGGSSSSTRRPTHRCLIQGSRCLPTTARLFRSETSVNSCSASPGRRHSFAFSTMPRSGTGTIRATTQRGISLGVRPTARSRCSAGSTRSSASPASATTYARRSAGSRNRVVAFCDDLATHVPRAWLRHSLTALCSSVLPGDVIHIGRDQLAAAIAAYAPRGE
jgi:hypothetical protein